MRSALREYYPGALAAFGTDLWTSDALAVLSIAPTPSLGRQLSLSKIASALRRGGRTRNIERKAAGIQAALRADYLEAPRGIADAQGEVARSSLALIEPYTKQIAMLESSLTEHFEQHPDAKVVLSLPGLGTVLGARVLGEFGDDRTRYASAKSRKTTAGRRRSPRPRDTAGWSSPATPETAGWAMRSIAGPSVRSPIHLAPGATTTSSGPVARPITRPPVSWPTAGSASSIAAWSEKSSTAKTSPGESNPTSPLDEFRAWGVYVIRASTPRAAAMDTGTTTRPSRLKRASEGRAPTARAACSHKTAERAPVTARLGPRSSPTKRA